MSVSPAVKTNATIGKTGTTIGKTKAVLEISRTALVFFRGAERVTSVSKISGALPSYDLRGLFAAHTSSSQT